MFRGRQQGLGSGFCSEGSRQLQRDRDLGRSRSKHRKRKGALRSEALMQYTCAEDRYQSGRGGPVPGSLSSTQDSPKVAASLKRVKVGKSIRNLYPVIVRRIVIVFQGLHEWGTNSSELMAGPFTVPPAWDIGPTWRCKWTTSSFVHLNPGPRSFRCAGILRTFKNMKTSATQLE